MSGAAALGTRKWNTSDQALNHFVNLLEHFCGSRFVEVYFFTSAPDTVGPAPLHARLRLAQIKPCISPLKSKNVTCTHCNAHFSTVVQAGVDVALATKVLTLVGEKALTGLFLLTGDGDFKEMLHYVTDVRHIPMWLAGFQKCTSTLLQAYANRGAILWLDEIWDAITYQPNYAANSRPVSHTAAANAAGPHAGHHHAGAHAEHAHPNMVYRKPGE
ncbi:hypothetical protein CAOG_001280 [Capsaspora owczarzaki ATCC 30864]|uniref:NYN domain-containing protein n=1 Tax=Capsaspora owczarzaki (strain ATCC 30864) TaxID=595528 RepID=A0A0D2VIP7_CAPO3|nr:hypothetical protein CAOG_001280 [Capsaspora owczarzaki ATCC 30864]